MSRRSFFGKEAGSAGASGFLFTAFRGRAPSGRPSRPRRWRPSFPGRLLRRSLPPGLRRRLPGGRLLRVPVEEPDVVLAVRLPERHRDDLRRGRGDLLADELRLDRQLAASPVDEDREEDPARPAEVEDRVDRGADRPPRVEDVVAEDDRLRLHREGDVGPLQDRRRGDGRQVVAVERDVEEARREPGPLRPSRSRARAAARAGRRASGCRRARTPRRHRPPRRPRAPSGRRRAPCPRDPSAGACGRCRSLRPSSEPAGHYTGSLPRQRSLGNLRSDARKLRPRLVRSDRQPWTDALAVALPLAGIAIRLYVRAKQPAASRQPRAPSSLSGVVAGRRGRPAHRVPGPRSSSSRAFPRGSSSVADRPCPFLVLLVGQAGWAEAIVYFGHPPRREDVEVALGADLVSTVRRTPSVAPASRRVRRGGSPRRGFSSLPSSGEGRDGRARGSWPQPPSPPQSPSGSTGSPRSRRRTAFSSRLSTLRASPGPWTSRGA